MVFTPVAELNRNSEPVQKLNAPTTQSDGSQFQPWQHRYLLQAALESFVDGILILTDGGEWVYANIQARRICHQLNRDASQPNPVAREIWRVCQSAIESRELFPREELIIESEVAIDSGVVYRIRVRWLELGESDRPFLLVTLENRYQSTENLAIADMQRYGLTSREAEVWFLRLANHSYKEIAAKLHITINTVKRHLKSIYAKQQAILCAQ